MGTDKATAPRRQTQRIPKEIKYFKNFHDKMIFFLFFDLLLKKIFQV